MYSSPGGAAPERGPCATPETTTPKLKPLRNRPLPKLVNMN